MFTASEERTPPDLAFTEGRPALQDSDGVTDPATPSGTQLSAVPSTLRIPLAARALGDQLFPRVAVGDAYAAQALRALNDDGALWLRDRQSVFGVLARTQCFRNLAKGFLAAYPDGRVINVGCGLSHYFQWLDNGRARMTDADLDEVLALRRKLLPAVGARHELREVDLTSDRWWSQLDLPEHPHGEPFFMMAEGVLMYLEPEAVEMVLTTFGERAPHGSVIAFDAMCWLAAGRAKQHPSVRHTSAEFLWGPRRLAELTSGSRRLHLAGTHEVMEGYGLPYSWAGPAFRWVLGVPFYALYELHVRDPSG